MSGRGEHHECRTGGAPRAQSALNSGRWGVGSKETAELCLLGRLDWANHSMTGAQFPTVTLRTNSTCLLLSALCPLLSSHPQLVPSGTHPPFWQQAPPQPCPAFSIIKLQEYFWEAVCSGTTRSLEFQGTEQSEASTRNAATHGSARFIPALHLLPTDDRFLPPI